MDKYKLLARAEKKINANQKALEESRERMKELKVKFSESVKLVEIFSSVMWQAAQADDTEKTRRALNQLKTSNLKVEEYARRMYEETKTGLKLLLKYSALNFVWNILDGANKKTLYPHYAADKSIYNIIVIAAEHLHYKVTKTTEAIFKLENLPAGALVSDIKRRPAPPTVNKYIQ
jgi:hypothetical protein